MRSVSVAPDRNVRGALQGDLLKSIQQSSGGVRFGSVIEVSGAGKAVVNAASSLEVDISGAGAVEYLGDPKVKQSISGIGKVRRREPS